MTFTVSRFPSAEQRLAELWLAASDQADVSAASDEIDRPLTTNPLDQGEVRTAKIRYLLIPPLAVYYEVRLLDRLVIVRNVWRPPA
jgi:hypothetical protein